MLLLSGCCMGIEDQPQHLQLVKEALELVELDRAWVKVLSEHLQHQSHRLRACGRVDVAYAHPLPRLETNEVVVRVYDVPRRVAGTAEVKILAHSAFVPAAADGQSQTAVTLHSGVDLRGV